MLTPNDFNFPGWHLIGRYPDEEDGVGSWLLHHGGEAMLLEMPPGLTLKQIDRAMDETGSYVLKYIGVSHLHEDHFDNSLWLQIIKRFRVKPLEYDLERKTKYRELGGERLWTITCPKHSMSDIVFVFRGVAMTGDIELGTLESVNREVSRKTKEQSFYRLRSFELRTGYLVHTVISAHLNDLRRDVDWESLFTVPEKCNV